MARPRKTQRKLLYKVECHLEMSCYKGVSGKEFGNNDVSE